MENWESDGCELDREGSEFFCFSGSMTLPASSTWMVSSAFSFSRSGALRSSAGVSLGV